MCILELIKILMCQIHYDNIKNKYDSKSKLLFTDTDNLMYEIITEDVQEDFSSNEETFDFSSYQTQSKYYDDSKKLVIVKMKAETSGAAIEKFFGLKPKMYSFLIYENSENEKAKSVNRNVVLEISHNEYTDVLLKNKCIRHSINTTHSKDDRTQTQEITYNLHCLVLMTKYIVKTMGMMD